MKSHRTIRAHHIIRPETPFFLLKYCQQLLRNKVAALLAATLNSPSFLFFSCEMVTEICQSAGKPLLKRDIVLLCLL